MIGIKLIQVEFIFRALKATRTQKNKIQIHFIYITRGIMYGDIMSIKMSKSTIRVNQSPLQSGLQCGSSLSSRTQSGPQTQGSPVSHCHFCRLCLRLSSTVLQDGSDARFLVSRGSDLHRSNLNIRKYSPGHCEDFRKLLRSPCSSA